METNYEKHIENIIGSLVNEALINSKTYSEAKLYISKRVSHNELGSMIKKNSSWQNRISCHELKN